jgi:hypothetical protein
LFAVVGSPAPIWIDGPQWDVCKEHNRSAGRAALFGLVLGLSLVLSAVPGHAWIRLEST